MDSSPPPTPSPPDLELLEAYLKAKRRRLNSERLAAYCPLALKVRTFVRVIG